MQVDSNLKLKSKREKNIRLKDKMLQNTLLSYLSSPFPPFLFFHLLSVSLDIIQKPYIWYSNKGSLISESFSLCSNLQHDAKFPPPSNVHLQRRCSGQWFGTFFGDLSQNDKFSEIRPPLAIGNEGNFHLFELYTQPTFVVCNNCCSIFNQGMKY